jgi:hypothetical protein
MTIINKYDRAWIGRLATDKLKVNRSRKRIVARWPWAAEILP